MTEGLFIPDAILYDPVLGWTEKILLAYLLQQSQNRVHVALKDKHIADVLMLTHSRASKVVKSLRDKGYITSSIELIGSDLKRYQRRVLRPKVSEELAHLYQLKSDNVHTSFKSLGLDFDFNYKDLNKDLIINNNNKDIVKTSKPARARGTKKQLAEKSQVAEKSQRFKPPTVEEVQAYCVERGNAVDAQRWHDFYTMKGWQVGRSTMKDWKAAVRTWEAKERPAPVRKPAIAAVLDPVTQALNEIYAKYEKGGEQR